MTDKYTDQWCTNQRLVDGFVNALGKPHIDPFPNENSLIPCPKHKGDGFDCDVVGYRILLNGPFSISHKVAQWAADCGAEELFNICLVAPGAEYWREFVWPHCKGVIWLGRQAFVSPYPIIRRDGKRVFEPHPEPDDEVLFRQGQEVPGADREVCGVHYGTVSGFRALCEEFDEYEAAKRVV